MRAVRAAVVGLVIVTIGALAVGLGAAAWITVRAFPQTSGTIRLAGLDSPATVRRDAHGIAQIAASTPHDLFMAQGFVHAQERMWQMEVWRHVSSGRLSELFGSGSLDDDRFIRTLGWRRAAERDMAALSPGTVAVLDAYAQGVNAWLDEHRDDLGLTFVLTGADPEPWSALDSLTWGKVQAWNLGGNWETELFRYLADARLGDPAKTDELFPVREFGPVIVPSDEGEAATVPVPGTATTRAAGPPPVLGASHVDAWRDVARISGRALAIAGLDSAGGDGLASDHGLGSQDWVVAPSMSASGGALLANDPHLGISMPSIWYINGLHCEPVTDACPYDVAGVSFPGVPGVVLGHNARISWGATNADPDVQDLVIETVDPTDPGRYIGPDGQPRPFTTSTERIVVDGGAPVDFVVRETVHGPILNDVDDRLADAPLMALRWTSIHPDSGPDRTVEAFLRLNVATDFASFRDALAGFVAPAQNLVYADVDGHIGYQLPGAIPIRSSPADRGLRPVSGSDGTGEWVRAIPFDELPTAMDPGDGWIVSANNAVTDDAYPHLIGSDFDPGYRAERVIDLVNGYGQDGLSVPEMGTIQADTAPLRARDIVPALEGATPSTADGRTVAAVISEWDGACGLDSGGCAAYMAWEYRMLRGLFDDELGPLARDYVGSPTSWVALTNVLADPDSAWWDDTATPEVRETAAEGIGRALDIAGSELRTALGEPAGWRWGRLHTANFREATVGTGSGIGPLEWYLNAGPVEVGGAAGAVNNTYYRLERAYPDPDDPTVAPVGLDRLFTVTNLPSYRLTVDMSDLDGAQIVITTGQSGVPFTPHYTDLIEPWRTGGTLPLPFTAAAIEAATVATLTLEP